MSTSVVYVGLDVHKDSIVIAMAAGKKPADGGSTIPNDWGRAAARRLTALGADARAAGLLRGRANRLRPVPATECRGHLLHRGRSFADSRANRATG